MSATLAQGPSTVTADLPTTERPVVPRWECRWFGDESPAAEARLAIDPAELPTTTVETYFVSVRTPHNVKLRRGTLEIKRLREIDEAGLERWVPVLRSSFPLDAAALAALGGAWGVALPPALGPVTSEHALDLLVDRLEEVRRVTLTKHRLRLTHADCPGELVTIEVAGRHWMSLAFEHADRAVVHAALDDLGLDPRLNLNYPAALKRLFALRASPANAAEGVP